jgi:serine/threonine protein kinase
MSMLGEEPPDPSGDTLPSTETDVSVERDVPSSRCLGEDEIQAFARGDAFKERQVEIDAHLDACSTCLTLVSLVARDFEAALGDSSQLGWPTTFVKGDVLSERFDVVRFVAKGGMGEVYEAFDRNLRERVALKTLLCTVPDTAPAVRRLCEEVRLSRRVAHRNVCRIHELHVNRDARSEQPPVYFLAMEFVEGETLKERLLSGDMPFEEVCVIARQLLAGLGAAHASDVLHLDFKSQNVMLRSGANPSDPVIMDFSLSRAFDTEARLRTSERHVAGSAGYMAPEQIECKPTCKASDLYSFGAVLFEMLTGRMAFDGPSAAAIMMKQLNSRPPTPSSVRPGLPPVLDAFVHRCLSRQPSARYENVESAQLAFEQCLKSQGRMGGPHRRKLIMAGGVILLGCAASSYYVVGDGADRRATHTPRPGEPEPSLEQAPLALQTSHQLKRSEVASDVESAEVSRRASAEAHAGRLDTSNPPPLPSSATVPPRSSRPAALPSLRQAQPPAREAPGAPRPVTPAVANAGTAPIPEGAPPTPVQDVEAVGDPPPPPPAAPPGENTAAAPPKEARPTPDDSRRAPPRRPRATNLPSWVKQLPTQLL